MTNTILKILRNDNENNLNGFIEDLNSLTKTLCFLTQCLDDGKVKLKIWNKYYEILLVKFSFHSFSMLHLLKGTPIQFQEKKSIYPDISSILLINRALIECYLTFYYLNIDPKNNFDERGEFRLMLYEISGLNNRQKFEKDSISLSQKKEKEKLEIEELDSKIRNNTFFKSLPQKRQESILKEKKATEYTWIPMIEQSPLDNRYFKTYWRLLSNYAHSEFISSIQLKEYFNKPYDRQDVLILSTKIASMLSSMIIIHLRETVKTVDIVYNTLPKDITELVEHWQTVGRKK